MQSNRFLKGDTITAVALIAFAGIFWVAADRLPKSALGGGVGADGLPKFLAVALGLLSLILLVQSLLRKEQKPTEEPGSDEDKPISLYAHMTSLGILVIGGISVLLLPILGYTATIALLLVAMALYHGQKFTWTVAIYGVLGAVLLYLVFEKVLAVPMPEGIWPGLFGLQS
ncbi:MAG TPA: tripartite tricarboxylate transporter TctB family protein [Mesorhizobium sp.]|jgi:cell division protein FtsW (lipid II flippase)